MIPEVQLILGCFALSMVVTWYIHSYYRVWFLQQDLIRIRARLREAMKAEGRTAGPEVQGHSKTVRSDDPKCSIDVILGSHSAPHVSRRGCRVTAGSSGERDHSRDGCCSPGGRRTRAGGNNDGGRQSVPPGGLPHRSRFTDPLFHAGEGFDLCGLGEIPAVAVIVADHQEAARRGRLPLAQNIPFDLNQGARECPSRVSRGVSTGQGRRA